MSAGSSVYRNNGVKYRYVDLYSASSRSASNVYSSLCNWLLCRLGVDTTAVVAYESNNTGIKSGCFLLRRASCHRIIKTETTKMTTTTTKTRGGGGVPSEIRRRMPLSWRRRCLPVSLCAASCVRTIPMSSPARGIVRERKITQVREKAAASCVLHSFLTPLRPEMAVIKNKHVFIL